MEHPALSVVVVSFEVREHLARCLTSLGQLPFAPHFETIVIDNGSRDGSAELVHTQFPGVRLICNQENLGFARANNQGLALARGRYLLLLNPDTEVDPETPDALARLVSFMDEHPCAGACGPRLVYPDGTHQHSAFRFPSLLQVYLDLFPAHWRIMDSRLNGRYPRKKYLAGEPFQVDHPLGAALMVRREAAEQVGWLDQDYFIYVEEVDWCWRIRQAGWQIWCVPRAVIIHHEAQSTRKFREEMFVRLWQARLLYYHKHYSPRYNALVRRLVRVGVARYRAQAARARGRGEISDDDLRRRIAALDRVSTLAGAKR